MYKDKVIKRQNDIKDRVIGKTKWHKNKVIKRQSNKRDRKTYKK